MVPVGAPGAAPPPAPSAPPPPGYGPYPAPPGYYPPPYGYYPPPRRATAGPMISETFHVFGQNLFEFIVPYLVYAAVTIAITLGLTYWVFGVPRVDVSFGTPGVPTTVDLNTFYGYLGLLVATGILNAIIGAILTGSLTYFAVQRHRGATVRLGDAFNEGMRRFLSILGASILLGLITVGLVSLPLGLVLFGGLTMNFALLGLGLLFLLVSIPVIIYVAIALSLYAPAVMMEGRTALGSLQRSWELTRGHRLSIFGAMLVIGILSGIVIAVAGIAALSGILAAQYAAQVIVTGIVASWSVILGAVAYNLILSEPTMPYGVPPYAVPSLMPPPAPPPSP